MIEYDFGTWGVGFIWKLQGSVLPRAVTIALPGALLTSVVQILLRVFEYERPVLKDGMAVYAGFTFVLGFLSVFRSQIAYARFWDGLTLVHQVRGEWFNAASNLVAFCNRSPEKFEEVKGFHLTLVQLMSLLYSVALQQIGLLDPVLFDTLGVDSLNYESLQYLIASNDRLEVVMQWVQRAIVDNHKSGVVDIAPPILSRVFQELSNGIVHLQQAGVITDFPFPFPYAQVLSLMMCIHWIITPVLCAILFQDDLGGFIIAPVVTAISIVALWSITYIAAEMEMPFGEDPNDLPMILLQKDFNRKLSLLLDEQTQCRIGHGAESIAFTRRNNTSLGEVFDLVPPPRPSRPTIRNSRISIGPDGNFAVMSSLSKSDEGDRDIDADTDPDCTKTGYTSSRSGTMASIFSTKSSAFKRKEQWKQRDGRSDGQQRRRRGVFLKESLVGFMGGKLFGSSPSDHSQTTQKSVKKIESSRSCLERQESFHGFDESPASAQERLQALSEADECCSSHVSADCDTKCQTKSWPSSCSGIPVEGEHGHYDHAHSNGGGPCTALMSSESMSRLQEWIVGDGLEELRSARSTSPKRTSPTEAEPLPVAAPPGQSGILQKEHTV